MMMYSDLGRSCPVFAFFTNLGVRADSLTVLADLIAPNGDVILALQNTINHGNGLYRYTIEPQYAQSAGVYTVIFHTADTVDRVEIAVQAHIGSAWVESMVRSGLVTSMLYSNASEPYTIIKGSDYQTYNNSRLEWSDTSGRWPDLSGATITFKIDTAEYAGAVLAISKIGLELNGSQTAAMSLGEYSLIAIAKWLDGRVTVLVRTRIRIVSGV